MKANISEQEQFSQAFLENKFLLENIQGGIVYSDFDTPFNLRYVTEGMSVLSGYSQEELLGMKQMDLVCDEDAEALLEGVGRQFSYGDTFTVEYRLKRKDGSFVYVLDRAKAVEHENGQKYIHCLLTDITDLKLMEQELLLSKEKYRLAIQQSGNVIIDFDFYNHSMSFSDNYIQLFGGKAPSGTFRELSAKGWVEEPYREPLKAMYSELLVDKKPRNMELRIKDGSGKYVWCNLHLTAVMNPAGVLCAVIGCLQNIDEIKQYVNDLKEQSERDGLTNIYNRIAMERMVNEHMNEHNNGTLVILDIDGFKQVNDSKGHAFGDEVLIDLARKIESILPKNAKFGRLGGDEFLIFLPWSACDEDLEALGQSIVLQVGNDFKYSKFPITVSLGLARHIEGGDGFKTLYKNADTALYVAKNNGRNGFSIFAK